MRNKIFPEDKQSPDDEKLIKRRSLSTVMYAALISLLLLFTILASLSYYRLSNLQSILSRLTLGSLPEVVQTAKISSQVKELITLTDQLSNASSQALRRIAHKEIESRVQEILPLAQGQKDESINTRLQSVVHELSSLNTLVGNRLFIQKEIDNKVQKLYSLHHDTLHASFLVEHMGNTKVSSWALNLPPIIAQVGKILSLNRLNTLRQAQTEIETNLEQLSLGINQLSVQQQPRAREISKQLNSLLLDHGGLLPLKAEQLRINGRTTGRSNFVRNLIIDVGNLAEYNSNQLNEQVIFDANVTMDQAASQTQVLKLLLIVTLFILAAVFYYLHSSVIIRLRTLNEKVLRRVAGEDVQLEEKGYDEISDIARSVNYFADELKKQHFKLEQLSLTDGLTGIANRRAMDMRLNQELAIANRYEWDLSVLLIDIDSFKLYNDHYGHLAGDDCLRTITHILNETIARKQDFIARFGGEEFVCILPSTNEKGAEQIAKNLLAAVVAHHLPHEYSVVEPYITISIGISTTQGAKDCSVNELLNQADKALYIAKESGRNQLAHYSEDD